MDKTTIRKKIKQKRLALSEQIVQAKSLSCFHHFKELVNQLEFNTIGIYMSTQHEMDTQRMLEYLWQQNKEVYIPKCENNGIMHFYKITSMEDVSVGKFNILEPVSKLTNDKLDVLVIPLIAINEQGYRLGMGGGYYDRFVSTYPTLKIGIGYEFQKENFIEEKHDLKFDYYISENSITTF